MQVAARSLPQPPSFQDNIATDEEAVSRPIAAITAAVTGIVDKVQTLLVYWEKKYQSVWDQDKEAYIRCAIYMCCHIMPMPMKVALGPAHMLCNRRYEKAQKPLAAFEADIMRYADLTEEIAAENAGELVRFLAVDCGPLKQVLDVHQQLAHACTCLWQPALRLTGLW